MRRGPNKAPPGPRLSDVHRLRLPCGSQAVLRQDTVDPILDEPGLLLLLLGYLASEGAVLEGLKYAI